MFDVLTPDPSDPLNGCVIDFEIVERAHFRRPGNYIGSSRAMETEILARLD
jgi:hypothetical protein